MELDFSVLPDQRSSAGIDLSALPDQPKKTTTSKQDRAGRIPVVGELRDFYDGLIDTVKTVGVNAAGGTIGVAAGLREWLDSRSKEKAEAVAMEVAKRYSDLYEPRTEMGKAVAPTVIKALGIPAEIADELISLPAESWKVPEDYFYPVKVGAELAAYGGVARGAKAVKAKAADLSQKTIRVKDVDYSKLPDQPVESAKTELDLSQLPDKPVKETIASEKVVPEEVLAERPVPETVATEPPVTVEQAPVRVEAPPTEAVPVPEGATGIKKAVVNAEREARGLDEVEVGIRTELGEPLYEGTRQKIATGELYPRSIAESIIENPRVASPEEGAALLSWRVELRNAHRKAMSDIESAMTRGDLVSEGEARLRLKQIEDDLGVNDRAARQSSYQWGVSGKNMQALLNEDYSLAAMIQRAKIDRGVTELPPKVRAQYEKLSKELEEAQAKITAHEDRITQLQGELALKQVKREVALENRRSRRTYTKEVLDKEFEGLKQEFSKVFGGTQLHAGIDPTAAIVLGKMAKNRVQSGMVKAADVVDSIYATVREMGFNVTIREIRDAISGYGKVAKPSQDAVNKQLRDLRHQMRLVSALEDAQSGKAPLKSGYQRDLPSDEVRELMRQVKRVLKDNGIDIKPSRTPEEQWRTALQTFKTRARNREMELERRIAEKDFSTKPKKELTLDREALDLQHKLDVVKRRYYEARYKDRVSRYNTIQKVGASALEMLNFSRAVMTSWDVSAPFRQGAIIFLAHPIRGAKALPDMFRALVSDKQRFAIEQSIIKRDNYPLYEKSGLFLAEHGQKLSLMEEQFMSHLADKVFGVAHSQRAYTTFLNVLRANSFDAMVKNLAKKGKATPEELKAIANYINVASGRGSLGARENALTGLNAIFFAPRYVASRFQMILGQPFIKGSARTRKAIAKEYARTLIGLGVVYELGHLAGAEIEKDPRSSDFGKLRFGYTRLDPMGGLSQATVLLARIASGTTKSAEGDIIPLKDDPGVLKLGDTEIEMPWALPEEEAPGGRSGIPGVIGRFLRSKLSPVVGSSLDVKTGTDVVGNEVTLVDLPKKLLVPLSFGDIYETMQEQGIPASSAMAILALFGMGLQTYGNEED